jgi:hypothetical protein
VYNGFVSQFNDDDFFVSEEELSFTKKELQEMLNKDVINGIDRAYGSYSGFNRIK